MDTRPHILIVDDDAEIRDLLTRFLGRNSFRVTAVGDGAEMRAMLGLRDIDLVVLDVMMPGEMGDAICRDIRKSSRLPIIMLTARGEESDRIAGLEDGADDYLAKPFNPRELLARINAVLRRSNGNGDGTGKGTCFSFAGWRLDAVRRELTSPDGALVSLTTGEYDLLVAFLQRPQTVLGRELLLDLARGRNAIPFDRGIDIQVSRLRRKIDAPGASSLIKTVRGSGYLFTAPVGPA